MAGARGELAGFDNTIYLHSVGRRPAAGFGRVAGVRGELAYFDNTSAGRRPAAGFGLVVGARRELSGFSSALCWPPSGGRLWPGDGGARELAGFDNTIFCTLLAAVRRPAAAGWRGLPGFDSAIFLHSAGRRLASGFCQVAAGQRRLGGLSRASGWAGARHDLAFLLPSPFFPVPLTLPTHPPDHKYLNFSSH